MAGLISTFRKNPYALQSALLFFLTGLFFIVFSYDAPLGDYANYYYGAAFCHSEKIKTLHDIQLFNEAVHTYAGSKSSFVNYNPVPLFSLVFYQPFTLLPPDLSKQFFSLFCLLMFCISWYRLITRTEVRNALLLTLPLIFLWPLKSNIEQGQSYLLIFSLLAASFLAYTSNKKIMSALYISLAIALKIFPVFLLFYFVFKRDIKVLLYVVLMVALMFLSVIFFCGTAPLENYLFAILPRLGMGEINDPWSMSFQSVDVLLRCLFVHDELLNSGGFKLQWLYAAGVMVFGTFLFSVLFSLRQIKPGQLMQFSVLVAIMTLMSGYGSSYGLLLFMVFVPAILGGQFSYRQQLLVLGVLLLLCNFPVHRFFHLGTALAFGRLYLLLFFIVLLVFLIRLKFSLKGCLFSFLLAGILHFPKFLTHQEGNYYLTHDFFLLNTEFGSVGHTFFVRGLNDKGVEETRYFFSVEVAEESTDLELKENQIFYKGKQVTFKHDNKKNLRMVKGANRIVYLSDQNRGVGFYTLRVIDLKEEGGLEI